MQELESVLSYCYTQILTNFHYIEHYLNLIAFKQNFSEITTTCSGTKRKGETFKKNILICSCVIVCYPNIDTCIHACIHTYIHTYLTAWDWS